MRRSPSEFARLVFSVICAVQCLGLGAAGAQSTPSAPLTFVGLQDAPHLKPPPPDPLYISRNDLERIRLVRNALKRRAFAEARSLCDIVEHPIARSLAKWYYFEARDPKVDIQDALAFLDTHEAWPSYTKIQRHVEERIPKTVSPDFVVNFFNQRSPITAKGKIALARALYATGEQEAADAHIRDAWINNHFTASAERTFLANYNGVLTKKDHLARVDRLLWERQVTNARRVFIYLPAQERKIAKVRAALLLQAANGRDLYSQLSIDDRRDPGIVHAAIRHYRRAGEEPTALAIARANPQDPATSRNESRHWQERQLLMRWALREKLYADAYAMAAGHGLTPGSTSFSEAEFNAGWIALRFLSEPMRADVHFAALTANVGTPISLSRGWYWLGRAAEARGEDTLARSRYQNASQYPYAFYGQLAAERLGGDALEITFGNTAPSSAEDKARFASRPAAQALRMLTEIQDDRAFLIFGYFLDDLLQSTGEYKELATAAAHIRAPHVSVRAGKAGTRRGHFAPEVMYPTIHVPEVAAGYAPPELILGLSRQESEFNPSAYSRAGARGVMQLMPATAQITARKERLPYRRSALLGDPHYNMVIGAAHVSHLLTDLNGSYPMVFAGYNAGARRVTQWIDAFGDPRAPDIDPIDWVEQIPFSETRNYVQRVLENTQVYRSRLTGQSMTGMLSADLERGGPRGRAGQIPAIDADGLLPEIEPRIYAAARTVLDPPLIAENPGNTAASVITADENTSGNAVAATAVPKQTVIPDQTAIPKQTANPAVTLQKIERVEPAPVAKGPEAKISRPSFSDPQPAPSSRGEPAPAPPVSAPLPVSAPPGSALPAATQSAIQSPWALETGGLLEPAEIVPIEPDEAPPGGPDGDCQDYVAFVAETAQEDAVAEDLNAGALAALLNGGKTGCSRAKPLPTTNFDTERR